MRFFRTRMALCLFFLVFAIILRLPFFFLSTDLSGFPFALTANKEALMMLQGQDVLDGHLPYTHYWNGTLPLGWFFYALLMWFSHGSLTVVRVIGAILVGCAGYITFKTAARCNSKGVALLAGCFYILFVSHLPAGQSVTYETFTGLAFASVLYFLLHTQPKKIHILWIALLYTLCVLLSPSFLFLLPALAVGLTLQFPIHVGFAPLTRNAFYNVVISRVGVYIFNAIIYSITLLAGCVFIYAMFYGLFALQSKQDLFLRSYAISTFGFDHFTANPPQLRQFSVISFFISCKELFLYWMSTAYWLVPFLIACFVVRMVWQMVAIRQELTKTNMVLFALLCFALLGFYYKSFMIIANTNYIKQLMPLLSLIMVGVFRFKWRDALLVLILSTVVGMWDVAKPAPWFYGKLFDYARNNIKNRAFYNDDLYRIRRVLNTVPLHSRDLFVCGEADMLYLLTNTMPAYYYLTMDVNLHNTLQDIIGHRVAHLRLVVQRLSPVFIVRKQTEDCKVAVDDLFLLQYQPVSHIGGYEIFMRNDQYKNFAK